MINLSCLDGSTSSFSFDLDDRISRIVQRIVNQVQKCENDFHSGKCQCSGCWIRDYYGVQKTLSGEVFSDSDFVKYCDENRHRGVLNRFVPESFPAVAEFLKFRFDFSSRNPRILQKFIPAVSGQGKTHFWNHLHQRNLLVAIPFPEYSCVEYLPKSGVEYIVHGVIRDSSEAKTSDVSFLEKILSSEKRPYAVLPIERSLYPNDSFFMSVYVLFNYLNSFKYYWLSGLNIIPFVIGSTEEQMRLCCMVLRKWGFRNVAWSLSGLNKAHNPDAARRFYGLMSNYFDQVVMVNFLSFRSCFGKSVFVSPDWYLIPSLFGKRVDPGNSNTSRCSCHFCKGLPEKLIPKTELSLCSLFRIFAFFESFKQTTLEEFLRQKE